jgi:hypothetical protein
MILSSNILTKIAQELAQYQEAKRAKKFLFYVTQRYWENEEDVIDKYSWESLLENLHENNHKIDDLKAIFFHAVNTLNRKDIYKKIAKDILHKMIILYYKDNFTEALGKDDNQVHQFNNELLDKIRENIENYQEAPRIKKLIFAACKQYWENDLDVIEMYGLSDIMRELHQLYPDVETLRQALYRVVSSINRKKFYFFIADTIVGELTYLYKYDQVRIKPQTEEAEENLLILTKKPKSAPQKVTENSDEQVKESGVDPEETSKSEIQIEPVTSNLVIPWLKIDNLFDLKQEIMQYTNPLRAKVILFYAIYQIDSNEQHWSVVRTCTLDDLLMRIFQRYGRNVQTIEAQLMAIAQSRIEGLEPEDNLQTVNAIVKAVKHFHQKS